MNLNLLYFYSTDLKVAQNKQSILLADFLILEIQKFMKVSDFSEGNFLCLNILVNFSKKNSKVGLKVAQSFIPKFYKDNQDLLTSQPLIWKSLSFLILEILRFSDFKLLIFSVGYSEKLLSLWIEKINVLNLEKNNENKELILILIFLLTKLVKKCEENAILSIKLKRNNFRKNRFFFFNLFWPLFRFFYIYLFFRK